MQKEEVRSFAFPGNTPPEPPERIVPSKPGICAVTLCAAIAVVGQVNARDDGRWAGTPADIRDWFARLMQPDHPNLSCCGESDAVEADDWIAHQNGSITARVTNGHGIMPEGVQVEVPAHKIKWDSGNPTGHSILFYARNEVYCFVLDSLR